LQLPRRGGAFDPPESFSPPERLGRCLHPIGQRSHAVVGTHGAVTGLQPTLLRHRNRTVPASQPKGRSSGTELTHDSPAVRLVPISRGVADAFDTNRTVTRRAA